MTTIRRRRAWGRILLVLGVPVFILCVMPCLYYGVVGFPSTPMTRAEAERRFVRAVPTGTSGDDVKKWLAGQGIPPGNVSGTSPHYDVFRREDCTSNGRWGMDQIGDKTAAEWAGLPTDNVAWYIRVEYHDAARGLLSSTEIDVYLFFDGEDRLLKCWVSESHVGL
jgi:hypothetical protein